MTTITRHQAMNRYFDLFCFRLNQNFPQIACRLFLSTLVVFLISFPRLAGAQEPTSSTSFASQFTTTNRDVVISRGDLLSITVFDTPEFSGTMRVSNEGNLSLPLIGSIHVVDMTAPDAAKLIRDKLVFGNFLKNPQVNVSFVDFINQSAMVLGDVIKPGPVPILGSRTLWEIIGAAGGVSPTAANKVLIIHKNDKDHPLDLSVNWNRDLSNQPNPLISLGDTVQIPRAGIVYVVGEVGRQGAFPILHEKMTMLQVITYSEGIKFTSKGTEARLIRNTPNGRQISKVDIPALLKGKIADFDLQNDDILYVPNSASKVVITRGLAAAVAVTTALAVYKFQ